MSKAPNKCQLLLHLFRIRVYMCWLRRWQRHSHQMNALQYPTPKPSGLKSQCCSYSESISHILMFSVYVFSLLSLVEISASAEKQRISKISTRSAPTLDPSMPWGAAGGRCEFREIMGQWLTRKGPNKGVECMSPRRDRTLNLLLNCKLGLY